MQQPLKFYQWLFLLTLLLVFTACGGSAARYNNQGNKDYATKKLDDAIENYRLAQQQNPDLAEPYYNAGNTRHRQNDWPGAATQLQQSLRSANSDVSQNAYYNLGNTYFQTRDWPKAIEAYRQALLLNPNDRDAKHNLELALQNQQQQQQQQNQQQQNNNDQQQQGGGGQPPKQQPDQQGDQNQPNGGSSGGQQPNPSGGSSSQGQQPSSGGQGGLSRQEAEQLLNALGQSGKTLPERLQQQMGEPGKPPQKDW
jgi:Ca-activated chloride channel homolog